LVQLSFVNFKKGSYIIVEGKSDVDRFYIIQQGKVQIVKETEIVEEETGNLLNPGDFLGVVSCMSNHSQIDTAIALTDVVLISIPYSQFPQLIEKNNSIAMKIIYFFSRKMRHLDERLTQITLKKNVEMDVAHLFTIGEYYLKMSKFDLALYAYYHYMKENPKGGFAQAAQKRFMDIKAMGVKVPVEMLEPKTDQMVRSYEKEAMIFCECQSGGELYIIQKGHVKITKIVDNNEVLLAVLKEGDMFGEMALLEDKPRSASAIVMEDGCQLLAVNRQNFTQMVATQPQLVARLTTTLADRIWMLYRQLANTLIPDNLEKMYDMLALQMEKARVTPERGKQYSFNFGPVELANMCGISKETVATAVDTFLREPIVRYDGSKIFITDQVELVKQVAYLRKMRQIETSRKEKAESRPW